MPSDHTRRTVLGAGASAAILALAGCEGHDRSTTTPASDGGQTSDHLSETADTRNTPTDPESEHTPQPRLGPTPSTIIVSKSDEQVLATDGRTHATLASGTPGDDDGRILRAGMTALEDGGRLFIRHATYEIDTPSQRTEDGGLFLLGANIQLISDYATLRFSDHTPEVDVQKDLKLFDSTNALVSGIILDGNRADRSTPTQTVNISESQNVTIRDCVVYGGSAGTDGDRGYGVAVSRNQDVSIDNCVIRDAERHGIHPGGQPDMPTRNVLIRNCTFVENADHPTGSAIDIRSHTHDCTVERCRFEGNGRAVKLKGPDVRNVHITENVIRDNYVETTAERGQVKLRTEGNSTGIECVGNRFVLGSDVPTLTAHVRYGFSQPQGTIELSDNRMIGGTAGVLGAGEAPVQTLLFRENVIENPSGPCAVFRHVGTLILRESLFQREESGNEGVTIEDSVDSGVVSDNILVNTSIEGAGPEFEIFDNSSL